MIGIIGAMSEEVELLMDDLFLQGADKIAGMQFMWGKMKEKQVVLVHCGVGKVNAAICAQILADKYEVDTIINTGVAGAMDARLDIGDVVISTEAVHHDMDASEFGDPVGQVPRLNTFSFPADKRLVKLAMEANEQMNTDIHTWEGQVVSGDQFVSTAEQKEKITKYFQPLCVEMEGAAIAQTAYLNGISYVIIRAISDKADNSALVNFGEFVQEASDRSARLVQSLIQKI